VRNPELFSSLTVLPGFPISSDDEAALGKLIAMPVTIFVGEQDGSWLKAARQTAATLNGLNGRVALHVLPDESHVLRGLSSAELFDAIALR
jgi:pimeloyl-ACP methyl ester carboxylesterase